MKIAACLIYIAGCISIFLLIKQDVFNESSFLIGIIMYPAVYTLIECLFKKVIR